MKARKVHTKIWKDSWFASLSRSSKLLFLYLITNEYVGISGFAEIPDRVISFDTGLTTSELEESKKEISPKVRFYKDWVYVVNLEKHDPVKGDKNPLIKARDSEIESVPEEIYSTLVGATEGLPSPYEAPLGKGRGKGKEGGVGETKKPDPVRAVAEHLISVFNQEFDKKYTLTNKRTLLIRERRKTFSDEDLERAVRSLARDPFFRGQNDRKWAADPDYLFRDDEKVDKALNLGGSVIKHKAGFQSVLEKYA